MRVAAFVFALAFALAPTGAPAGVTFTDVAAARGIDNGALAQGCAWGDYDGDGFPDLYLANNKVSIFAGANNKLLHNDAGSAFTDQGPALGVDDGGTAFGVAWADYDNDGKLDLYLVRGVVAVFQEDHRLYHDEGPATRWTQVPKSGLPVTVATGRSVAWADFDNDGLVDVYVTGGLSVPIPGLPTSSGTLLRNRGDGTFEDVTARSGLATTANGVGVAWGDYDNDGWPDLYVVNHGFPDLGTFERNALYHNRKDGTFEDVTAAMQVGGDEDGKRRGCFGAAWADYDNDGFLDLYVACGFDSLSSASGFDSTNLLYRNSGGTGFTNVSFASLTADPEGSFGCAWGDFDNDGLIDLYVANGRSIALAPTNRLFRNQGPVLGYLFLDAAAAAGVASDAFSQATAWADYDGDGKLDLYVVEAETQDKLYHNDGGSGSGSWLELSLAGTTSNRAAIGARVYARTTGIFPPSAVTQMREVSGGSGYQSQNDLTVHFGLGSATSAEVEVHWPGPDFCVQKLGTLGANQRSHVVETCPAISVLRAPYAQPLSGVFPLPRYARLPPAAPFVDPQAVLSGAETLLYQADRDVTIQVLKSGGSIALYWN